MEESYNSSQQRCVQSSCTIFFSETAHGIHHTCRNAERCSGSRAILHGPWSENRLETGYPPSSVIYVLMRAVVRETS